VFDVDKIQRFFRSYKPRSTTADSTQTITLCTIGDRTGFLQLFCAKTFNKSVNNFRADNTEYSF